MCRKYVCTEKQMEIYQNVTVLISEWQDNKITNVFVTFFCTFQIF